MKEKDFISVREAAEIMGISRIAVFNKIKKGDIEAKKIGRNYIVDKNSLGSIYQDLTPTRKKTIERAVTKATKEYRVALKKLSKE